MKRTIETIMCDVCSSEVGVKSISNYPVVFTTEQTEGRNCSPYLAYKDIDLCKKCYNEVLYGNGIFGEGAMGHNEYYFKGDK